MTNTLRGFALAVLAFLAFALSTALLVGLQRGRFTHMVGADSWFIYYATRWAPWLVHWIVDRLRRR